MTIRSADENIPEKVKLQLERTRSRSRSRIEEQEKQHRQQKYLREDVQIKYATEISFMHVIIAKSRMPWIH
jgi:hypothetical protein